MKWFLGFVSSLAFTSAANATTKCDLYRSEIGTKVQVALALGDGQVQSREFVVTSCKNEIFTAYDKINNSTIMQYDAGQGDVRKVRFLGNPADTSKFQPAISGTWNYKTRTVNFSAPTPGQCPPNEHWDSSMGSGMCMPNDCGPGEHWDQSMNMCMPDTNTNSVTSMFHYNQFIVLTGANGPRGKTAISAPNMWMLMYDKKVSNNNTLELSWMGTSDLWTVPKSGTPELFQTGDANSAGKPFVDAQHPHSSPIMGLTFSDILSYGANGEHKLTFFFAPRGEATAGPESFMHRASSEGNPDAPLSHHLQDVFHISSTVVGVKADYGKWTVDASAFSGIDAQPTKVNLDMHTPDSFAVRGNYRANDNVTVGGSVARVKALDFVDNPLKRTESINYYSAWVQTSNAVKNGTLNTASIWGQADNRTTGEKLNSFLEEFMYELGKNNFYGRLEVLQRTPDQLEIQVTDGSTGAKWIKALTFGYERQIQQKGDMKIYAGAAVTAYSAPKEFKVVYGNNPVAAKVYLRIKFNTGMPMGH